MTSEFKFPLSVTLRVPPLPLKGARKGARLETLAPFLDPFRGRGGSPEGRDGEGA